MDGRAEGSGLARLLKEAGSRYDVAGVRRLVAGVVAAPRRPGRAAWPHLVADPLPAALERALLALAEEMRRAAVEGQDGPVPPAERLAALRTRLAELGVQGFLVPRADEHQGEYVPKRALRLAWITGFTGSAGLAVVLARKAAVFVDGRYTLQAEAEVDGALFERRHLLDEPPAGWIAANLAAGEAIGYDPRLHTLGEIERLTSGAEQAGGRLVALPENPIDAVWRDQPPPPLAPVVVHDTAFSGESAARKREMLAAKLAEAKVDAAVLTAPESVAWLLNIRGGDVPRTPLPLAFAVLKADATVDLFIDPRKLMPGVRDHLGNAVAVHEPDGLGAALDALGAAGRRVQLDPASAPVWFFERLQAAGARIHRAADPCLLPRACKNDIELAGMRAAHRRDGAALTRFLAWIAAEAPKGQLTEIAASDRLEALRSGNEHFRDLSFETISGAGPNGAIVHYRASAKTERRIEPGSLYLVDSGAQYLDGTTDVTRTIAIGAPAREMVDRFTRVLKGHIAVATTRFPKGTTGSQLDVLARHALWQVGLDYDHGTGHGVGSYLNVHEGPHRIAKVPNTQPLLPGMVVSNEPGYYKTGAWGIRIENLVTVVPVAVDGAEREMLGFETLTLAPIDRTLIDAEMLSPGERAWLDGYHAEVRTRLTPLVDAATASWLAEATRPLAH